MAVYVSFGDNKWDNSCLHWPTSFTTNHSDDQGEQKNMQEK